MKISYSWLQRHVDLSGVSARDVARELTLSTAEVEGVEAFLPHLGDVTVGHVVRREKHPDADKLSLCKVDVGQGEPLQIVCGAPNVRQGLKVAVATSGVVLPGDFKIKKSKIRGVESNGMICSERELGLGDEHDGIWELPGELRVGESVAAALGAEDWVIEIDNKSLTHRPDLWGHRGVARELAAILRRPLQPLEVDAPHSGRSAAEASVASRPREVVRVRIETEACSRYFALAIDGARAERSPLWLRRLLLAVGQRPIDLLVDLSNFVMLDLGQPNHLFDRRRLSPEGIVVRMARAGETMKTLDGVERKLGEDDMLICSGNLPVALAGVMGGESSKVEGDTSQLVLEVATFHPTIVRRTSTRLGLRTDSSARFEKSLDPELPPLAARHFVQLLRAGQPDVRVVGQPTDVGEWRSAARRVPMRFERVRAMLGVDLGDSAIVDILQRLEFGVETGASGSCVVLVPSFRGTKDVTLEQDLVEEVGRIHRYGAIPERELHGALTPPPRDERWKRRMLVRRIEDRLALAARFHQLVSYSFVHDSLLEKLGESTTAHVTVRNSIAEGFSRVRRGVVPSVLAVLEANRRRSARVRLFEVGKGYLPAEGAEPVETHEVALALCAPRSKDAGGFDAHFARLKGVVDDLVRALGLEAGVWRRCESAPSWANPGRCAELRSGDGALGELAQLEPGLARALGLVGELESDTALARLSIDALLAAPQRTRLYQPIPQFPQTLVDVALALPEERGAAEAVAAIERSGKGLVASLELFDLYRGPNVGEGRKSLAWHVVLRAPDRTLAEQDVRKFLERLEREALALGGALRRE